MKWVAGIAVLIALIAVAALVVVLRIGVAVPPKLEAMTVNDGALRYPDNNLHIILSNQSRREIAVEGVLDDAIVFSASLIRDQHFGVTELSARVTPGSHSVEVRVYGRPPVTKRFSFSTAAETTNFIAVTIWADADAGYRFDIRQSTTPFGMM